MSGLGLIQSLPDGPLDIIGDVHGELAALERLLGHLRLRAKGEHRHLVFVGDLVDRGPDSPGVVRLVAQLVAEGRASCVLGNHELNLLRAVRYPKRDNSWFRGETRTFDGTSEIPERRLGHVNYPKDRGRPALEPSHYELLHFVASLPLALEREDIRVVHAAWDDQHIADLRNIQHDPVADIESIFGDRDATPLGALSMHEHALAKNFRELKQRGIADAALADIKRMDRDFPISVANTDGVHRVPEHSEPIMQRELLYQNQNPVRVITSGFESPSERIFVAGGKWRFTKRDPWWQDYQGDAHVVMGHYWRSPTGQVKEPGLLTPPNPFADQPALGPLRSETGPNRVWCIDFSIGRRYLERHKNKPAAGRLAALRWPERELVFDTGERHAGLS